jgi:small subunit ribosomal protein S3
MGQKVNPNIFRLKINHTWESIWYAEKKYKKNLHEDIKIRNIIYNKCKFANINKIYIERPAKKIIVNIYSSKPGIIIGKKGTDIKSLRKEITKIINNEVIINITEVKKPEIEPLLIAKNIASQLEKRISFRKIIKRSINNALKLGSKGIKITISGRLGGVEIARKENYREGRIPLHTIRAKIKYDKYQANTIYGKIGIKVWIYKGGKI